MSDTTTTPRLKSLPDAPTPIAPAAPASGGGTLRSLPDPNTYAAPAAPNPIAPPSGSIGSMLPDWLTRPVAKSESPTQAMADYGLSIGDALTMGYGGKLLGKGTQDAIAQAHQNLGLMDYAAQGIGYGLGPGKILGPVARGITKTVAPITATAAPGIAGAIARGAGSVAAGGLESGAAGGIGTYGHEQGWTPDAGEIGKNTAMGALVGAAGGLAGGSGPTPKVPEVGTPSRGVNVPATGMYAQKEAGYQPLQSIYFDRPAYVGPINQATANLRAQFDPAGLGTKLPITQDMRNIVKSVTDQPTVTGYTIQKASTALRDLDNGSNPVAHRLADAFDNTLANAPPRPGSMVNGAPAQAGDAMAAKQTGDLLYGRIRDLETLGDDPSALTPGAVKQVQAANPQNAPKAGTPQSEALNALKKAQQPGFNWWMARHIAAPMAGAATGGLEGYFNAAEGQNPLINAAIHSGEDALLFGGLHSAAAPRPASALNAARYAIATSRPLTTPTGRVGDYLMNLWAGNAASGSPRQ